MQALPLVIQSFSPVVSGEPYYGYLSASHSTCRGLFVPNGASKRLWRAGVSRKHFRRLWRRTGKTIAQKESVCARRTESRPARACTVPHLAVGLDSWLPNRRGASLGPSLRLVGLVAEKDPAGPGD